MTGMFPNSFPLPSLKVTKEKLTFTYSDALVLLVACWYGLPACVFIAGIEGFTSSRRVVRRFYSNLYSSSMMSLAAASAAVTLGLVLNYGFGDAGSIQKRTFLAVAVAMLIASIVHIVVNSALFSLIFSVRLQIPFIRSWKQNLLWTAPMFLPTSAAASLMFVALQHNALTMIVIGTPLLLAIHFGHRHYSTSVQEQFLLIERAQQERIAVMEKAHRETIEALAVAINA